MTDRLTQCLAVAPTCDHNWQHVRSQQWTNSQMVYSDTEKGWFGAKLIGDWDEFWRQDDYYCSKCLEEKSVKRNEDFCNLFNERPKKPEWWSDLIDIQHHIPNWGTHTIRFYYSGHSPS